LFFKVSVEGEKELWYSFHLRSGLEMKRRIVIGLLLGLVASLIVVFLGNSLYLFRVFELKGLDFRLNFRGARDPRKDIVIVAIDEESIRKIGRWPWPRRHHAQLIDYLSGGKPKAILFDVFITEPDLRDPENDRLLIEATKKAGNVYYDYFFVQEKIRGEKVVNPESFELLGRDAFRLEKDGEIGPSRWINGVTAPILPIVQAARGIGHANFRADEDDIYRWMPLTVKYEGKLYPSIVLKLCQDYLGVKKEEVRVDFGNGIIT